MTAMTSDTAHVLQFPRLGNAERPRNDRLYAVLIESGESYETLAQKIGVDSKTVQRWVFDGGRTPYARLAKKAADILSVDAAYLWPSLASARKYPSRRYLDGASDATAAYRAELIARRDALQRDVDRLKAELDYMNAVLSIPVPATSPERQSRSAATPR